MTTVEIEGPRRINEKCEACLVVHATDPYEPRDTTPGCRTFLCPGCLKFRSYCFGGEGPLCDACWVEPVAEAQLEPDNTWRERLADQSARAVVRLDKAKRLGCQAACLRAAEQWVFGRELTAAERQPVSDDQLRELQKHAPPF